MNRKARHATVVLVLILALVGLGGAWAAPTTWVPTSGSEITVSGTSSLHDWTVRLTKVEGELVFDAADLNATSATVRVAVAGLESDKEKMTQLAREALGVKKHPEIRFDLRSVEKLSGDEAKFVVRVGGDLTIHGTTQALTFEATAARIGADGLEVSGKLPIKMTDYGVKPPTAMLGTIKTRPDAAVNFRWNLSPSTAAAAAATR